MKRVVISVLLFSLVFTGNGYGQGSKPVKSISLDRLLGKKKTENAVLSTTMPSSKVSQQGYREHIGAIGSVLERIELKGNTLTQDKISTPYRRYVVNGTMDLGGKTISMPDGCILDLENGSLKNGSIKMNTTKEEFIAQGEVITFDGFIKVYKESVDDEENNEEFGSILPQTKKGDQLTRREIQATEKLAVIINGMT